MRPAGRRCRLLRRGAPVCGVRREVRDTTGAGDSFNAGFIYGMVRGMGICLAAAMGNACGSVSVTRYGGASACASLEDAEYAVRTGRVK